MNIKKVEVGFLNTNCYILEKDDSCLIIDPGDDSDKIINLINKNVIGIIITHYHFDHIGALDSLVSKYECNVYDNSNLNEGINTIENFKFLVIKTPGHKSDLISLLFDNNLFCGDFIFENGIGRTDLPTGNFKEMVKSIKKVLLLPDDIVIYPGHGNQTTLFKERDNLNKIIKNANSYY